MRVCGTCGREDVRVYVLVPRAKIRIEFDFHLFLEKDASVSSVRLSKKHSYLNFIMADEDYEAGWQTMESGMFWWQ